ncbi:MAG TPA: nuclear transport factor 2 family protein [Terriglobales bacterium]|nr:nuclear transport factor 2 family protein [Terriglobales bacterium]
MRSVLAPLLILSVLLGSAIAKTPDPPKNTTRSDNAHRLRDALTNMEKELARAEQQKNKHFFNDVLTPQFLMVAYDGLVFTKPELLSKLNYLDVKQYAMNNFKVRLIGQSGALLTYDLDIQASAAGQHAPRKQYASSVWVREGGHWQLLFHQATPANH